MTVAVTLTNFPNEFVRIFLIAVKGSWPSSLGRFTFFVFVSTSRWLDMSEKRPSSSSWWWATPKVPENKKSCCVFRPGNACASMHLHGRKRSKTLENDEKSTFSIMCTRGSCKAHEEKRRKKFPFSSWTLHEPFTHAFAGQNTQQKVIVIFSPIFLNKMWSSLWDSFWPLSMVYISLNVTHELLSIH